MKLALGNQQFDQEYRRVNTNLFSEFAMSTRYSLLEPYFTVFVFGVGNIQKQHVEMRVNLANKFGVIQRLIRISNHCTGQDQSLFLENFHS